MSSPLFGAAAGALGAAGLATTAGRAIASRLGGTNQAASARSQSALDRSIGTLSGIASQNTDRSQAMADAANAFTAAQNDKAMEFSAREAAKNRDWQKMMSDTAHQREVRDLLAAGLNPVLSAMGGNGAAVTSGATASSSSGTGQKGEVDTSLSHGFVSLLSTMLSAQTQLAQTAMSARSNEAIADKNNSMSQLIAEMTGQQRLAQISLENELGAKRDYQKEVYANYRAGLSSAASRYAADQHLAASKYSADTQYAIHRDFPNSTVGALASILTQLFGGDGEGAVKGAGDFFGDLFGNLTGTSQGEGKPISAKSALSLANLIGDEAAAKALGLSVDEIRKIREIEKK